MTSTTFNFITGPIASKINTNIINDGTPFPSEEVKNLLTVGNFTSTDEYKEINAKKADLGFDPQAYASHEATIKLYGEKETINFKSSNAVTIAAKKYFITVQADTDKASYVAQQIKDVVLPVALQYVEDNKEAKDSYEKLLKEEKEAKKAFNSEDGKKSNGWINDTLSEAKQAVVTLNKKITSIKVERPDDDDFEQLEEYNALVAKYEEDVAELEEAQALVKTDESLMKFVTETKSTKVLADKSTIQVSRWALSEKKYLNSKTSTLSDTEKARIAPRIYSKYAKKDLVAFGSSAKIMSKLGLQFVESLFSSIYKNYAKDSSDAKSAGMFTPNVTEVSLKHFDQLSISTGTPFDILFNIETVTTMNPAVAKEVANGFKDRATSNTVYTDVLKRVSSYINSTRNAEFAAEFKDPAVRQVIAYMCITFLNTISKCVKSNLSPKDRKITPSHFHSFLRPLYIIQGRDREYPIDLIES